MSGIFPSSLASMANSAATYIRELADSAWEQATGTAGAFAAVQSTPMECNGRPATTEITKKFFGVPPSLDVFNNHLKGQLDAVVDDIKGLYIVDIQITPLVSHAFFEARGRKRVEAVWTYLFRKHVNPNLMSTHGQGEESQHDGIKIKIIGVPRGQAPIVRAGTMPDRSALSCTVRLNDGTSITTGPR